MNSIDDIVNDALNEIQTKAGYNLKIWKDSYRFYPSKENHMLTPEEIAVYVNKINAVYKGDTATTTPVTPITTAPTKTAPVVVVRPATNTTSSTSTSTTTTPRNQWIFQGNHWYYKDNDGISVKNHWIGRYYLKADGRMAESEWIYDDAYNSWFYVNASGSYVENAWVGAYYLKSGGYMAKYEWIFDKDYDAWYYLNPDGAYARNQWIRSNGKWYYLLDNGKMATNTTINGYTVNAAGEWIL